SAVGAEVAEDVLHHDDGRVGDDAKVDGSDRNQVRRGLGEDDAGERPQQCQRDGHRRDERSTNVSQEDEQDQRDKGDTHPHVFHHGRRRETNESATIVVGLDLHPGGKEVVLLDELDLGVDAFERWPRLGSVAHQNGALDHIGPIVDADHAQTRRGANLDVRDVAHTDGCSLDIADDHVLDVVNIAKQPDAADIIRLLAHLKALSARVDVGVLNGLGHLRKRDAVAFEAKGINADLELLGFAAVAYDIDYARHLLELTFENPVFRRLQ